jgi:hypothetical protein
VQVGGKIFINYRHDDDPGFTRAVYLRRKGEFDLFLDEGHIQLGKDFVEVLNTQVAACDVLLVVIGPHWAELLAARQGNAEDFVTIEIKAALDRDKRVIPVLANGAGMPHADTLPETIRKFARCQAVSLRPDQFMADSQGLVTALKEILAAIEQERAARRKTYPKNSEQLWLWLRDRPIEVSRAIAARGALRALPWASHTVERLLAQRRASGSPAASATDEQEYDRLMRVELEGADSHLLKVSRGLAVAWFAAVDSSHATAEVKAAAVIAARDIHAGILSYDIRVAASAYAAALTAHVDSVRHAPQKTSFKPAGRYAADAAAPHSAGEAESDVTTPGRVADLDWFESGQTGSALMATPLWPGDTRSDDWTSRWQRLRTALLAIDPSWLVWISWYEDRMSGAPFRVEVERHRVLVPEEIWNQPPAAVNTYIAQAIAGIR